MNHDWITIIFWFDDKIKEPLIDFYKIHHFMIDHIHSLSLAEQKPKETFMAFDFLPFSKKRFNKFGGQDF